MVVQHFDSNTTRNDLIIPHSVVKPHRKLKLEQLFEEMVDNMIQLGIVERIFSSPVFCAFLVQRFWLCRRVNIDTKPCPRNLSEVKDEVRRLFQNRGECCSSLARL